MGDNLKFLEKRSNMIDRINGFKKTILSLPKRLREKGKAILLVMISNLQKILSRKKQIIPDGKDKENTLGNNQEQASKTLADQEQILKETEKEINTAFDNKVKPTQSSAKNETNVMPEAQKENSS